jgi:hypothetical protein
MSPGVEQLLRVDGEPLMPHVDAAEVQLGRRPAHDDPATVLASRAAAHTSLVGLDTASDLLGALREAGAQAQAAQLIERLPATGRFRMFLEEEGRRESSGSAGRPMAGPPDGGVGQTLAE